MNTDTYLEALRREREGYVARDLPDRVAQVDAEIARYGAELDARVARVERSRKAHRDARG